MSTFILMEAILLLLGRTNVSIFFRFVSNDGGVRTCRYILYVAKTAQVTLRNVEIYQKI